MESAFSESRADGTSESNSEIHRLVESAAAGEQASLENLLNLYTDRLTRMICLRIDRRISARIDVEDVVQEVHMHASQHLVDYVQRPAVPFYLWLRGVAVNVLLELHRRHLGTRKRDARVEVSLQSPYALEASSQAIAKHLAESGTSPSNAAMRIEWESGLKTIVDSMPPADKEVLALRHFEQLNPRETAQVLQISEKAAGMRYIRALRKLRQLLSDMPGGLSQWRI
jgi:RNA polymerase sigma-70 factor (ECF subfamily)